MTLDRLLATALAPPLARVTPPEQLLEALADVAAALDAAHAAGFAIPPIAGQGVASLGLTVTILAGQQAERKNSPTTVSASMAEAERVRRALLTANERNTAP